MIVCKQQSTLKSLCTSFAEKNKAVAVVYVLLVVMYPLKDIGWSHVFGKIIQSIQKKSAKDTQPLFIIMACLFIFGTVISCIDQMIEVKLATDFESHIRNALMVDVFKMQATNYQELEIAEVISRTTQLPSTIFGFVSFYRDLVIPRGVTCIGILIYFAFTHPTIAIVLLAILIAIGITYVFGFRTCTPYALSRERSYVDILRFMDDVFRNMMSVLNSNKQPNEMDHMNAMQKEYAKSTVKSIQCLLNFQFLSSIVTMFGLGVSVVYMYRGVKSGKINVGSLVTIIILLSTFLGSASSLYGSMRNIVMRSNALQESLKIFRACSRQSEFSPLTPASPSSSSNMIPTEGFYLHNVSFIYPNDRVVFTNLNLHIKKGAKTLFVGPIGSGKSTLFNLIMKYQLPSSGHIYLDGVPYTSMSDIEVRKRIGYVPQSPILFNRTIYDNIAYGNGASRKQVEQMFHDLDMQGMLQTLPAGLDTSCGKSGSFLSGGQRQIIIIMRVLLQNPDIVLFDEPTSAVDDATKQHVMALLHKVMEGRTIVMITHDPRLMKLADHVVNMNELAKTKN